MKNKRVEEAILKGIQSKGAADVSAEIADEIFSDEAQNQYFIDNIFEDKGENMQISENIADKAEEERQASAEPDGENIGENQEQNFGKFKNPTELYKAYCELEKEFTRRSQRLKQMEGELVKESAFESEEQWKNAVDKFFENTPSAKGFAREIAQTLIDEPELKRDKNCLSIALTRVLANSFRTPQELMSDGQFLDKYVLSSPVVRDKIISQYLDELRRGQPPVMLVDNGMQCVAPTIKPKSIEEAGIMFLKNNK